MKALILSAWEDTGGVGIGLKRAMEKWTDWEVRVVHRHHNYIEYETDIYWEPGTPKPEGLDELFRSADVIHVMERWSAVEPFDGWRDKPLVMHHHGTEFRVDRTDHLLRTVKEYRALPIVSTIDLTLIDPEAEWLPNPVDVSAMRTLRSQHGSPTLRVAHSPTNRALKATDLFLSCVETLPYNVDLIEWMTWRSGLRLKGLADVVFDQLFIGYALSGIEAMAMGIPVVAGASDARIYDLMRREFGYIPFLIADEDTLRQRLEMMLDPGIRGSFAELGTYHVMRYHDESRVAARLHNIWERAGAMR